jgi:ketosteroid isomerase-like protein
VSQEDVEIVREHFAALIRELDRYWEQPRSFVADVETGELGPDGQAIFERLHPDIRWTNVFGEIHEGKLGCARGIDSLLQAAQEYRVRLEEVTDLDDHRVLVVVESRIKGEISGATGAARLFTVQTLRDGLLVQGDEFLSRAEALQAVGLPE